MSDRWRPQLDHLGFALPQVGGLQTWAPAIAAADRAIRPVSVALGVFGGLAALSFLFVVLQVIGRQLRRHADETATAPGAGAGPAMTMVDAVTRASSVRSRRWRLSPWAVAIALSPLFPLGPVRPVYPAEHRRRCDGARSRVRRSGHRVLRGIALLEAYQLDLRLRSRGGRVVRRPSAGRALATTSGLSVSAVTGVRFAVDPGDRDPVPVRSAIVGRYPCRDRGAQHGGVRCQPEQPRDASDAVRMELELRVALGFAGDEDLPAQQSGEPPCP